LIVADNAKPEVLAIDEEENKRMALAIKDLRDPYRLIIDLRYSVKLSYEVIGSRLGLSADAARKLCYRSIDLLRLIAFRNEHTVRRVC
jgi:RNA polymerase sigma factor (sigma-70 family)